MDIDALSECLNLPDLQSAVDDIEHNFLSRNATRKWILNDFPENELRLGRHKSKIKIPSVLASMLNQASLEKIKRYWHKNYGIDLHN